MAGARPASIPEDAPRAEVDERRLGPTERWLRSRVAATTGAVDEAMAGYAFGEVTRILYDAIWSEFCDWGLELAKVRLADESLPAEEHEATWWTLVDALDAYLRLLHPVMPFVTEALWAAIPHRASDPELLITARWPEVGQREGELEVRFEELFETITAIRNARSNARIDAPSWLETHVAPPGDVFGFFEELAPAIERLARARPLVLHGRSNDLPRPSGSLEIVLPGGDIQATVLTAASGDAAALERTRLEKELAEAEGWLAAARARLANPSFVGKARRPWWMARGHASVSSPQGGAGGSPPGAARKTFITSTPPWSRSAVRQQVNARKPRSRAFAA